MGPTSITLDGTDASSNSERPSTALFGDFNYINTVSMEAVQEVQTSKGVIPAEYSRALSGNVNLLTKSGTNKYHGSLFENFQSEELNARNQFLSTKPGFTFNQFGGSVGGPIVKNRIFGFGVYEGYREAAFQPVSANVPTAELRAQMLAAVPAYSSSWIRCRCRINLTLPAPTRASSRAPARKGPATITWSSSPM